MAADRYRPLAPDEVAALKAATLPLSNRPEDFDHALAQVTNDVRLVIIGDSTHGTHEFYRMRAELTKRLIDEHGFDDVVLQADWPAAYQVNQYVRNSGRRKTAVEALAAFEAFPQWLWRNADVLDFVGWLQRRNATRKPVNHVGVAGMDLYSLYSSIAAVLRLCSASGDAELLRAAQQRYEGFFQHGGENDPHLYGATASLLGSYHDEAMAELKDLLRISTRARRKAERKATEALRAQRPFDSASWESPEDPAAASVVPDVMDMDGETRARGLTSEHMLPATYQGSAGPRRLTETLPSQAPTVLVRDTLAGAASAASDHPAKRRRQHRRQQRASAEQGNPAIAAAAGRDSSGDSSSGDDVHAGSASLHSATLSLEDAFLAEQNARIVANAEQYYRAVFGGATESWNVRERHMADTLAALMDHAAVSRGRPARTGRLVVWAHSAHSNDARYSSMSDQGLVTLGQLCRERWGSDHVRLFGFATYTGTVMAAPQWGAPAQVNHLRVAPSDSWEGILHGLDAPKMYLDLRALASTGNYAGTVLQQRRPQRVVSVVYRSKTDYGAHYHDAALLGLWDGLYYLDGTRAVEPLETVAKYATQEMDLLAGV